MAMAYAECRCATCGKSFEKSKKCISSKDARSWEKWASGKFDECPDCSAARISREREEASAAAAAEAKENGLPELEGSERQIAWAVSIRKSALDKLTSDWENMPPEDDKALARRYIDWLAEKASAHWWIDNGRDLPKGIYAQTAALDEFLKQVAAEQAAEQEAPAREAAQAEMTVEPSELSHSGRVVITVTDSAVSAKYHRDDEFRSVVKGLGYTWNSDSETWMLKLDETTGSARERAAELGNKLLNAGFAISIADPEARRDAIDARYTPRHTRWITAANDGKHKGSLCISLQYGDGMYEQALDIPRAKYSKPNIVVPADEYASVEDFAARYDYSIALSAAKLIEAARRARISVKPAPAKNAEYTELDAAALRDSKADVLDDLIDED